MSKSKHAPEFRAMVAKEYIDGAGSSYELAEKYHVGRATLQKWVALFREQGIKAFITQEGNKSYTSRSWYFKLFAHPVYTPMFCFSEKLYCHKL